MRTDSRRLSRRAFLAALAAGGATAAAFAAARLAGPRSRPTPPPPAKLDPALAEDVRAEFLHAYRSYRRFAADHDELRPLSGTGSDFFAEGHPVALTTIEALDTLYLMEADDELAEGIALVTSELSFDIDAPFQVFETIIRLVGGLLSAHHASGDDRLLERARDLADRLMPAFERSPTGMPYRFVNLHSGEVSEQRNVLAEIGTCITELGHLSRLTRDDRYLRAAQRAQRAVVERRSALDLVGTQIDIETGEWTDALATVNPPVDSFFEYLHDAGSFLDDADARSWFDLLTDAIVHRQSIEIAGRLWFSTVDSQSGAQQSLIQSELAAFYAGLLAEAGRVDLARRYHDSWAAVLEQGYRILPEWLNPETMQATDPANQLRPEYVDAAFALWLRTGDELYVERAVEYYQNMKATSRVENGYTVLINVGARPELKGDLTPAYWFSENMKYYWLMFVRARRFDYADHYLTTEGNVLRGLIRP